MSRVLLFFLPLMVCLLPLAGLAGEGAPGYRLLPGKLSPAEFDRRLAEIPKSDPPAARIPALSSLLLGAPYVAGTLVGGPDQEEELVVSLGPVDCMTLLETVEAMRSAERVDDLPKALAGVRYRHGIVSFETRNHFFSDWSVNRSDRIVDVTAQIAGDDAVTVEKQLNRRGDGAPWIPGIPQSPRTITYLPVAAIDGRLERLRPGDYLGIYSDNQGLDVSHVGIVILTDGKQMLRHASSRRGAEQVVDEPLREYVLRTPGILVYRAADGSF